MTAAFSRLSCLSAGYSLRRRLRYTKRALLVVSVTTCMLAPALHAAPVAEINGLDRATMPGDDFYRYVNGGWIDANAIPADKSSWGVSGVLADATNERLVGLIREIAANPRPDPDARRVGDYFTAWMDEAGIASKGLAPLKSGLSRIAGLKDKKALAALLGTELRTDVDALNSTNFHTENLFGLWVVQGLHHPATYHPYLLQGGLGLPDRDYYLSTSPRMVQLREAYVAHVAKMLTLAAMATGSHSARPGSQGTAQEMATRDLEERAAAIAALETRLAQGHASRADSADVQKADNSWRRPDFNRLAPGMDWDAYFKGAQLARQLDFIVWHPTAVTAAAAQVASTPLAVWQDYLTFHAINQAAPMLPKAFADAHFAFYGTTLSGTPQQSVRWKRALAATNQDIGFSVGKLYVTKYFPPEAKARAQAMVANIVTAFGNRIDRLDWMAPATKAQAREKLKTLYVGVGYPDRWKDYTGLTIRPDDAPGNARRAALFAYEHDIARLGKPVDRFEWCMVPQVINAVNMPMQNALNFPAAILQPPYFDPAASDARNYGAIGAIIGHEISHSFDDQGAQFDAQGRLANWWTKEDLAHFEQSSAALAAQYSAYKPFPDLAVNGQQTLSENIADLAGLLSSYDAFRSAAGGAADDREFFTAYGLAWRSTAREAALRRQIATDGHAPARYRVSTVRNLDTWYDAFSVQPGQGLYLAPEQRVRVW